MNISICAGLDLSYAYDRGNSIGTGSGKTGQRV